MEAFHGREGQTQLRDQPRKGFTLDSAEWSAFCAACEIVGVQPTGKAYWQWRLHEGPFSQ